MKFLRKVKSIRMEYKYGIKREKKLYYHFGIASYFVYIFLSWIISVGMSEKA